MTSDPVLYRSIVDGSNDLVVAFDGEGTIVFANEAAIPLLGYEPVELVGRSVFDFIQPDDVERAMLALDLSNAYGSAPGTTIFRLVHRDESRVFADVSAGQATDDGERVLFTAFSRRANDRFAITETLMRLLDGGTIGEALRPVCDIFAWETNGSQIGISWTEDGRFGGAVATGIPLDLVGGHSGGSSSGPADRDPADLWTRTALTGETFMGLDLSQLTDRQRALAREAGMGAFWIEPVGGAGDRALITVWTRTGGRPPLNHSHAMATVKPIVEIILRWVEQQRRLDFAAFHDPLTGVANRTRFFDALRSSGTPGSVLYCDLDRFKAVNDELGHAAGDELLRLASARLLQCVRGDDLVARLGGDEFAVLCPGASIELAAGIGERIEAALTQPFSVAGTSVSIGVSVGIGHAADRVGDDTLESADEALYRVKAERRGLQDGAEPADS